MKAVLKTHSPNSPMCPLAASSVHPVGSGNELLGHISCSDVIFQAGDACVTLLSAPEVLLRVVHRCKRRSGSGKSQWYLLATFSAYAGSSGRQPVWPVLCYVCSFDSTA